jgi:hypothetical protein
MVAVSLARAAIWNVFESNFIVIPAKAGKNSVIAAKVGIQYVLSRPKDGLSKNGGVWCWKIRPGWHVSGFLPSRE